MFTIFFYLTWFPQQPNILCSLLFFILLWVIWLGIFSFGCILLTLIWILSLWINSLTYFHLRHLQLLKTLFHFFSICDGGNSFIESFNISIYLIFHILWYFVIMFLKLLLSVVDGIVSLVLQIYNLSSCHIIWLWSFSLLNHLFNLCIT